MSVSMQKYEIQLGENKLKIEQTKEHYNISLLNTLNHVIGEKHLASTNAPAIKATDENILSPVLADIVAQILLEEAPSDLPLNTFPSNTVEFNAWKSLFKDIGDTQPIPEHLRSKMAQACPFSKGKRVHQTHQLIAIPLKIGGKPTNFINLINFFEQNKLPIQLCCNEKILDHVEGDVSQAYWMLVGPVGIPSCNYKSYDQQQAQFEIEQKDLLRDYEIPNALELVFLFIARKMFLNQKEAIKNPNNLIQHLRSSTLINHQHPVALCQDGEKAIIFEDNTTGDYYDINTGGFAALIK